MELVCGGVWMVNYYKCCMYVEGDFVVMWFCVWLMDNMFIEFMEYNVSCMFSCL